jgi:hypothetical protein
MIDFDNIGVRAAQSQEYVQPGTIARVVLAAGGSSRQGA